MAKKVVGREMTSKVGLDSAEAVKSLKQLTAEVKANTSGWKAQETALKSAGEYQKAASARVDGLAKSMEMQKSKIDELKSRQSGLNRNTKDGEEAYLKLSDQINKASRSYDSMGGQLDRAKSKLQYYNSGLADLQKGYKQSTALSKSYVERLESEGKQEEANKARLNGLKQAYSNMESQYKAQTNELDRIKTASGATSDAYKRQQVRVNETATAMAKAKTSQSELLKAMEKEPHGFMHGVRSKLDSIDDKAKKTSHLFGTILGAHLVANGITNALSSITASFGELNSAVTEYDNKQRTMTATWTTLTGSNGKGKQMVDIGNGLASAFNQNINVVDELNQSFYHVFDNAPRTKELTKSILTLGDTLNLSDENVTRLGTNFTHMLSSGKMQLGDFNMINDQLPMYAEKMLEFEKKQQHNSKLTMSSLRDQMSAGKISAKDAEEVMNSLGGKYAKASENLMKTIPGMERSIKTQMPALLDAIYKPIANMKSPLMGQFTKWIGDKDTKSEFKDVGNALALQINDITKAFAGKNFNVGDSLNKMLSNLAKGIDKMGANIVAHKKEIKSFFSSMKTASKTSFNVFVQSLKDIEPILKIVGEFAEKHPKVFAGLASSAFVASKGISALKLAFSGLDLAKGLGGKLSRIVFKPRVEGETGKRELTLFSKAVKGTAKGIGKSLVWTAKIAYKGAKGAVSMLWKGIKGTVKGIGKGLSWTAKIAWKGASKAVGLLWKATKGTSKLIGKGLSWTAKIAYKGASKAFSVLGAGIKTLGKSFLSLSRLLLANPIGLVLTAVVALGVAFYEAYKHIKPFREWVNKTAKSVVNFGKGIAKWGSNVGKSVGKALSSMSKKWNGFKKSFAKAWNKHWSDMGKSLRNSWNGSLKHTREFFSSVGKKWDGWKSSFRKSWSRHWNTMTSNLHSAWNSSYKHTKGFFSNMGTKWAGWKKSWSHSWNHHWDTMRSNLHSYWNKDLSHTRVFGHSMGDWLSSFKKSFKSGWSGLGTGVENIFKGLWKNLKKFARDGMNDVIDLINGGINAVDSVIHTFGGKKKTIGDLSHVHFATGTGMFSGSRNPITKPTLAMLNDGHDSPDTGNKEMVMLPNGDSGIVQGRNTKMMLPAGTEVLNASETAMLMSMQGVTKYAKGTGIFGDILNSVTSGISGVTSWVGKKVGSLEKFFNTATNIIAHPVKSLENLFSWSSKGVSGVMSNIGHGLFNGVENQAKTWWSTLWGGVSDSLDSGASSSTLVNAMEKYGATNKYVYGAEGPSAFDCSGLVEYTLKKLGISFPRTSGEQYKASKHVSNPKPGDLVFFGPGGSEHVGVYTGNGEFYSAENEKDGMGISKVHGGGYGTFAGYGRVPGLSDSTSSDKSSKSSGLLSTIKKQVGSGFWKFISKLADEFGDGGSSNPGGSGVQRWKPDVIKALKKNGFEASASQVSAWMKVIARESNGDPTVVNHWDRNAQMGMPSMGLVQTIRPTFEAYKFPGHNNPLNGYDDLLAGIHYMKAKYGSGASAFARVSGPEGYENGGIINTNQLIEVAEHNKPEMVLPLTNKSRANQLIAQASQVVNGNNGSQVASTNSESNEKLDKLISLMSAILANMGNVQAFIAKSDVINTIKSDNKTNSQYSQMMGY
ncbi:NlpC/P60 family protein [Lactiplantibacillus plantarum]|uniref:NlpC/P60 family protein n=1 Tax=Lactiplantibacillus plantarum TaxID=1590 RepID=UPI00264DEFD1|nr:NlpC/P60 family protein [Lactiplantibacillus plantarum]MDN7037786.1 peptidase M23 [Lactiplantibacillus plantarum]